MLMITPRITNILMNGMVWSLFLRRNSTTIDAIVIPNVRILNFKKVCFMLSRGFVKALELAAAKKAGMFSIESGKN